MTNREARRHGPQVKPKAGAAAGGARKAPSLLGGRGASGGGSGPVRAGAGGGGSLLKPNWAKDTWSEIKKVQWPTRAEAWNLTLVVMLVAVALGVALGGIDTLFGWVMQNTVLK
jgi:preprotein translocase SecE subunit